MEQLHIDHITKRYGHQVVLDDLSFDLAPGKIYGLLGRNGAGKSTLLNIITSRIFPTAGAIKLGDQDGQDNDAVLGQFYLMSEANLYPKRTTVRRMFDMADESYGGFDYQNADRLLKEFGVPSTAQLSNLSTGLQTAAKLTVALSVNAAFILLDEPVLGLDANHREVFYKELIKTYQNKPRTFVLSTHLIDEIQQVVEHVFIIDDHHLVEEGDVQAMLDKAYAISGPAKDVDEYTNGLRVLAQDELGNVKTAYVYDQLDDQRVLPDRVKIGHYDLQHLFIYLTNGGTNNE
jgi:ABC-2 type transport system ATP-binding protein